MKKIQVTLLAVLLSMPILVQAGGVQQVLGDYVEGEVLVMPKQGGMVAAASSGYQVLATQKGAVNFLRMKLKPGQNMLSAMSALSKQPWVASVEPNYIYKASAIPNDPDFSKYWGLKNTGQAVNGSTGAVGADMSVTKAWDINTDCSSVTVAVIDTGVDYNHPDLTANIWLNTGEIAGDGIDNDGNGFVDDIHGWDFSQGDNDPMDFAHHGTHVAGTIGASGNNGVGGTGVCQTAKIMAVRVLNASGSGTTADILAGVNYAVANGAKVINLSLGGPNSSTLMSNAIFGAPNVLFVIAAGNETTNNDVTPSYPASYTAPNIISVAATTQTDGLASFSNYGATSVDVGAPGTNIRSTVPPARTAVGGCSWNFDAATLQSWTSSTWDTTTVTPLSPAIAVIPNTVGITTELSASPSYSITDSPGTLYANYREYIATSPACNLTGVSGSVLQYNAEFDIEPVAYDALGNLIIYDALWVESSSDGVNWVIQDAFADSTLGSFYSFETGVANVDGYATAQVRFRLSTDGSVTYGGFHVDDIQVTQPNTAIAAHSAADYAYLNGTSMATPNTAGVAALVWANEPNLTALQLKDRLLKNGDDVPALAGKTVTGKRINAVMSMPMVAPAGLTATAASATRVNLTWQDKAVNEAFYVILRDNGTTITTIATLPANTTTYSDTLAPAGTTLKYKVYAKARDGRGTTTSFASVTTPAAPAPSGGGGGCVMGVSQGVDPLLPLLFVSALALIYRRRKHM